MLRDTLATVGAVNVHLAAAVGAVHETGQRMDLTPSVGIAPDIAANTLHVVEGLFIERLPRLQSIGFYPPAISNNRRVWCWRCVCRTCL